MLGNTRFLVIQNSMICTIVYGPRYWTFSKQKLFISNGVLRQNTRIPKGYNDDLELLSARVFASEQHMKQKQLLIQRVSFDKCLQVTNNHL
jgi:hypothetical protein